MNKAQEQDTVKELMGYLLPAGTMDFFELTHIVKDKEGLVPMGNCQIKEIPENAINKKHEIESWRYFYNYYK